MAPRIDHIDLTVRDLDREEAFYDALLPLLGFDLANKGRGEEPGFEYRAVDYSHKAFSLTLVCPRPAFAEEEVCRRKPGSLHHLAFGAGSREEVDRLYALVKEIPGCPSSPPRNSGPTTPPTTMPFSSRTPTALSWKSSTSTGRPTSEREVRADGSHPV